jgi:hypothetical protein
MRRGQGDRLPIPTEDEFEKAVVSESEIVACSGRREGPLAALCMALNSGHTATVCVDELSAVQLVAALKALFPGCDTPPASPAVLTEIENGIGVQVGHQSGA